MILVEYECAHCGVFEFLEERAALDERDCPTCTAPSHWVMSAPKIKPNYASTTTTGKTQKPEGYLSTEAIADGMSVTAFKAERDKRRKERIRKIVRSKIG